MAHINLTDGVVAELKTSRSQEEFYDSAFPGPGSFGVRAGSSGKKTFFLVYPVGGRRRRMTLGHFPVVTLAEARERAVSALREVESGRDPSALARISRRKSASPITFGAAAAGFITECTVKHIASRTLREYRRILERELLPHWEHTVVSQLTPEDVAAVLNDISKVRNRPAMGNRVRALAGAIFNFARRGGHLFINPVESTSPHTEPRRKGEILKNDQILRFWRGAEQQPFPIQVLLKLLLLTGQRVQDLLKSEWKDVEFDALAVGSSRGRRGRVALSPLALDLFRQLRAQTGSGEASSQKIFIAPRGDSLSLRRPFAAIAERVGTPLTARDLRLTVRAQLYRLNVRPDVVEFVLNNQTIPNRFQKHHDGLNYEAEARAALLLWSKTLSRIVHSRTTPPGSEGDEKVIPLFR